MAITLTDRAAKHVQNYLTKRGKGVGVRLRASSSTTRTKKTNAVAAKVLTFDRLSRVLKITCL